MGPSRLNLEFRGVWRGKTPPANFRVSCRAGRGRRPTRPYGRDFRPYERESIRTNVFVPFHPHERDTSSVRMRIHPYEYVQTLSSVRMSLHPYACEPIRTNILRFLHPHERNQTSVRIKPFSNSDHSSARTRLSSVRMNIHP